MAENYGDRFEGLTIVAMSVLIISCLLGAVGLQVINHRECTENHYTYCGDEH